MTVRIVQLGSPRSDGETVRLGTVRRPPRGVPKDEIAARDFYDVWLPVLAPSAELVKQALAATTDAEWKRFVGKYRKEMATSDAGGVIAAIALWSQTADLAVGCYCDDAQRCHRSTLGDLLADAGADVVEV